MIAHLQGLLFRKESDSVIIDVNGVGYRVVVSQSSLSKLGLLGESVALEIHTHVREDAFLLYGFYEEVERDAFEALIGMTGVGPKLAIAILSGIEPAELAKAVCSQDLARLCLIPGIGKKKAERMVLELKDRLLPMAEDATGEDDQPSGAILKDLRSALGNLGFKTTEVESLIAAMRDKVIAGATLETLVPEALKLLRE